MQQFLQINFMTILMLFTLIVIMAANRKNQVSAAGLFRVGIVLMLFLLGGDYIERHGFEMVANQIDIPAAVRWRTVGSVICYVLRPVIIMLEVLMISPSKRISVFCTAPAIVNAALIVPALFGSSPVFYISETGQWCEGPLYAAVYAVIFIYLALLFLFSLSYFTKKNIKRGIIILAIIAESVTVSVCEYYNFVSGYTSAVTALCMLEYYVYLTLIFQHDLQISLTEQKLHTTQTNILLMLNQIQPHFLFNALNTIRALYAKDLKLGERTLEQFSSYLRQNLDYLTETELISVEKELEHTHIYTDIEKLRFPNIQVQYEIKDTEFEIPPLTIQPLVENAIRHGIRGKKDGIVTVSTVREGNVHRITIKDNGVGFDQNKLTDREGTHIGLQNVRERVEQMCSGTLTVSSEIGTGTEVTLLIPHSERSKKECSHESSMHR